MSRNPNSGLDRVARVLPVNGAGKIFFVGNTSTPGYNDLVQLYGHRVGAYYGTIDAAVSACTANRGDVVVVAAGHDETVASAGAIALDVAGVSVIGLGQGADRPTLTFSATASTLTMSAASCSLKNFIITCSIDAVVSPIVVSGADCEVDVESRDASTSIEFTNVILTTAAADNLKINLKHVGFTGGSGNTNAIRLVGGTNTRINIDYFGVAGTAVVEFHTTAVIDCNVYGYMYNSGTTDYSKDVVDTVTGSTWYAELMDGAAGAPVSGGSGNALAAGDLSAIASNVAAVLNDTGTTLPAILGTPATDIATDIADLETIDGTEFIIAKAVTSSDLPNNAQSYALTGAGSGKLLLKEITVSTDGTGLAGPTNIEFSTDNTYGVTGADGPLAVEVVGSFGANATVVVTKDATSHTLPMVIEDGSIIYMHGDDGVGTGAGVGIVSMLFQRIDADASIASA